MDKIAGVDYFANNTRGFIWLDREYGEEEIEIRNFDFETQKPPYVKVGNIYFPHEWFKAIALCTKEQMNNLIKENSFFI